LLKTNPQTVQITFAKNAQWSDGKPMTGADFKATWQVSVNPKFNVNDRTGYDDIKSVTAKGKTAIVVFKQPYADWENLVSTGVYPAHLVNGKDMNEMFLNSIPVSSGPWKFDSWQKGVQLTVVRNPQFKVGSPMKLDKIVWKYILDTNARFQAIKANDGQATESQAQLQIADFLNNKSYSVHAGAGYSFEHIDIEFGPKGHPALKRAFVRQALITGINRAQIAGTLYKTIYPGLKPLQSLVFFPVDKQYYKPNYAKWSFSQTKAIALLKKGGCTGGPDKPTAGNSDIFSCPGVGKLSFRVPLLHHDRQPAACADVRDHPEAAEERRDRDRPPLRDRWNTVRHDAAVAGLGPDDVRALVLPELVGIGAHARVRLRRRRQRDAVLQQEGVRCLRQGLAYSGREAACPDRERRRGEVDGQRRRDHPALREAVLPHRDEQAEGPRVEPDHGGLSVERERVDLHGLVAH
jgi:hypothetical protein